MAMDTDTVISTNTMEPTMGRKNQMTSNNLHALLVMAAMLILSGSTCVGQVAVSSRGATQSQGLSSGAG